MKSEVLFSSRSEEWSTPQWLFDTISAVFDFQLDVCATHDNAKCKRFYSKEDNGLKNPWAKTNWMNPPYGRGIGDWMKKACLESSRGCTTVCLVPARTDTKWWHEYVENNQNAVVIFIKGRLKYSGAKNNAPFPSAIVVFYGDLPKDKIGFACRYIRQELNRT
jgi:phage N-6-adenine-methyltransferase